MNKKLRITLDLIIIAVAVVFLIFGIRDAIDKFKGNSISDNMRFARVFSDLYENNIYKYISLKDTNRMIEKNSGVILIANHNDEWTGALVKPLEDIVKNRVDKIYYLELDGIDMSSKEYLKLTKKIGNLDTFRLLIIKNGKVLTNLSKTELVEESYDGDPKEYFEDTRIDALKEKLEEISNLN